MFVFIRREREGGKREREKGKRVIEKHRESLGKTYKRSSLLNGSDGIYSKNFPKELA